MNLNQQVVSFTIPKIMPHATFIQKKILFRQHEDAYEIATQTEYSLIVRKTAKPTHWKPTFRQLRQLRLAMKSKREKLLALIEAEATALARFTAEEKLAAKGLEIFKQRVSALEKELFNWIDKHGSVLHGQTTKKLQENFCNWSNANWIEAILQHPKGKEVLVAFGNTCEPSVAATLMGALEFWVTIHEHKGPHTQESFQATTKQFEQNERSNSTTSHRSSVLDILSIGDQSDLDEDEEGFFGGDPFQITSHAIYSWVGDGLLKQLKDSSAWVLFLEYLQAERMVEETGKNRESLLLSFDRHPAMHEDGLIFIDTDVLHDFKQHVRVDVVYNLILKRYSDSLAKLRALQAELVAVVQYVYNLACTPPQTVIRMFLGKRRVEHGMRAALAWRCFHAAAISIQSAYRRLLARRYAFYLWEMRRWISAIKIQARWRGYVVRCWVQPIIEDNRHELMRLAAIKVQALTRKFFARKRYLELLEERAKQKEKVLKEWAAITIQRYVRGFLGQRIAKHKRINNSLHENLSSLVDKFMINGDIWGFLKRIDQDFRRLQKELEDAKEREDQYAETFITKVLAVRDQEATSAWDQFHNTLDERFGDKMSASLLGKQVSSDDSSFESMAHLAASNPALPGVRVRQAIKDAEKKEGRARKLPKAPNPSPDQRGKMNMHNCDSSKKKTKGLTRFTVEVEDSKGVRVPSIAELSDFSSPIDKYIEAVGPSTAVKLVSKDKKEAKRKQGKGKPTVKARMQHSHDINLDFEESAAKSSVTFDSPESLLPGLEIQTISDEDMARTEKMVNGARSSRGATPGLRSPQLPASAHFQDLHRLDSRMSGFSDAPSPARSVRWEDDWHSTRIQQKVSSHASSRFGGTSALRDLPNGLQDTVDRLMVAAMLRFHVPMSMPPETTSQQAYEMYLMLPPSLAKVRHEQECSRSATKYSLHLHTRGYTTVQQMWPPSKVILVMQDLNFPKGLINIVIQLVREVREVGTDFERDTLRAKKQMHDLLNWSGQYSPLKYTLKPKFLSKDVDPVSETEAPEEPETLQEAFSIDTLSDPENSVVLPPEEDFAFSNKVVAELLDGVSSWGTIESSVGDFLCKAAFYVVQHQNYPLGNKSFNAFIRHLSAVYETRNGIDKCRSLIQERSQAALLLSAPFAIKMQIDGLKNVRDLGKTSLNFWGMPPPLFETAEKMLSKLVASHFMLAPQTNVASKDSKLAPKPRKFDPRFQRSPFDPKGRPPRLARLRPLVRPSKDIQENPSCFSLQDGTTTNTEESITVPAAERERRRSSSSDLPGSIWSQTPQAMVSSSQSNLHDNHLLNQNQTPTHQTNSGRRQCKSNKMLKRVEGAYVCSFKGCMQQFSRAYTLKLHEKTHESFGEYHRWRTNMQLFRDGPSHFDRGLVSKSSPVVL